MSVTDEIKARIDIVSYVQRYVPGLKKAGRNHKACCPFHNEKTPSFIVNPERGSWHCFGACAEGGDIFSFAQKMHGWDFKEALRELAREAGVQLRAQTPQQKDAEARLERLRGMLTSAADYYHQRLQEPDAQAVRDYLAAGRGFHDSTVVQFQLGYAPDRWDFMLSALRGLGYDDDDIIEGGLAARSDKGRVYDRFRKRLIIPIRDARGRVAGFGGRALDPADNAKYINSPQGPLFDKSRLLFGLDMARRAIRESDRAIVVEGYFDVVQAHQAGHLNVVAQMGTAMTEAQLRLLAPRLAKRVVLALDADEAGKNATRRSLDVARGALEQDYAGKLEVDIRVLQVPAGKDPDDFIRAAPQDWGALVENAQAVADFVIETETAELPPDSSLQQRQALARDILPILRASENQLYRQENIQKLARRLRIGERELLAWAQPVMPAAMPEQPPDLPPEYFYSDYDAAPPDEAAQQTAAPAPGKTLRAAEGYCLSQLLRDPDRLAQVNRKFRELAGSQEALRQGPLRELGADDFTSSRYRALMVHLQESLAQDDLEPLAHLLRRIDVELRADLEALLEEESVTLSQSLRGNFQVDLSDIVKKRSRERRQNGSPQDELISRALQLRQERLRYERVDLQYLQEEAQQAGEADPARLQELGAQIRLSMQAKAAIDLAVS